VIAPWRVADCARAGCHDFLGINIARLARVPAGWDGTSVGFGRHPRWRVYGGITHPFELTLPDLQRGSTNTSVVDVLDHILDEGIVIDALLHMSVIGIDLLTVEARIVVATIDTYLTCADAVAQRALAFRPSLADRSGTIRQLARRMPAVSSLVSAP
jgi:hypothetical protein